MFLYLITIFIFWFISYKKLKKDVLVMTTIINRIKISEIKKSINEEKENQTIKNIKGNNKRKKIKKRKNNNAYNINNYNINGINNIIQTTKDFQDKSSFRLNMMQILTFKLNDVNIIYINELLEQKDFEINSLEYEEALKLDKRNYFQYYISLLKYNHPLMFSFGTYNDYNSKEIKIFLFFFSFSSDFAINALFFNDDTMHKIYQDKGKYNLLFQIPQILYSTLISRFIDTLIKNLALFQNNIVELKQKKGKKNIEERYVSILNIIRIKIILFFVIAFIFLLLFWYYITCFCGIYVNTQIHLIKDTVISLILSLIVPFGINLIPGIFRILSLRMEKSYGKCFYKFSSFLENYLT